MVFYVVFLASVVVGIPSVFVERKKQMTVLTAENTMLHPRKTTHGLRLWLGKYGCLGWF